MSTEIEQRVVQMRFDNQQFESGTKTTMSTLERLKASLKFDNVKNSFSSIAQGFGKISDSMKNVDTEGFKSNVESVRVKFSALEVFAVTALQRISNFAITAGKNLVSAFAIDPITDGFKEYELKMSSIRTIMSSTGADLETVKRHLEELNTYSDKTIYSFSDMTENIGKFTNAGVKLDVAVKAIQGVSNLAAVSGANANEASRAMYNFAQALSAGHVKLIDWKSIENANMATVEFKNQLLEAGVAAGTLAREGDGMYRVLTKNANGAEMKELINATTMFNDSLAHQWMTTDVLIGTLGDYADVNTEIGKKAMEAATEVTTFTGMMDALKEAAGSGWATTWELIIGDLEQAKALWTSVNNVVSEWIGNFNKSRNDILQTWNALGGREDLLKGLSNIFKNLGNILGAVGRAFREVFPRFTGYKLVEFTKGFKNLTEKLMLSENTLDGITNIFKSFFKIIEVGVSVLTLPLKFIPALLSGFKVLVDIIAKLGGGFSGISYAVMEFFTSANVVEKLADNLAWVLGTVVDVVQNLLNKLNIPMTFQGLMKAIPPFEKIRDAARIAKDAVVEFVSTLIDRLQNADWVGAKKVVTDTFEDMKESAVNAKDSVVAKMGDAGVAIERTFSKAYQNLKNVFSKISSTIKNFINETDWDKVIEYLGGLVASKFFLDVAVFVKKIGGFVENIGASVDKFMAGMAKFGQVADSAAGILNSVKDSLEGYQKNLKADRLMKIAIAIGILAASVYTLCQVDSSKLLPVLGTIGGLFVELTAAFIAIDKFGGFGKGTLGIIGLATAILLLSKAVTTLAGTDTKDMFVAIGGIAALMVAIGGYSAAMKVIGGDITKSAVGLVAFSVAIIVLTEAVKQLIGLPTDKLAVALTGIVALSTSVALSTKILGSTKSEKGAVKLLAFASSVKTLAKAAVILAELSWEQLAKGLTGVGALLAELAIFSRLVSDKAMISTAIGMGILAGALLALIIPLKLYTVIQWKVLIDGLAKVGTTLAVLGLSLRAFPNNVPSIGAGLILVGGALLLITQALQTMYGVKLWDMIKSLGLLGGSLYILATALTAMNGTLMGSAALTVAAVGLVVLAQALEDMGEIVEGGNMIGVLISLAAALGVLVAAAWALAPVSGVLLTIAAALGIMSASVLVVGLGLTAVAAGITALGVSLAGVGISIGGVISAIAIAFTKVLEYIINVLPTIGKAIVKTFAAIAEEMIGAAPTIFAAITAIMVNLLKAIGEIVPQLAETALKVIDGVLEALANHIEPIVANIVKIIIGIIRGISVHLPELIDETLKLLVALFEGIFDALARIDFESITQAIIGAGLFTGFLVVLIAISPLIPAAMAALAKFALLIGELIAILIVLGGIATIPGVKWLVGEGGELLEEVGKAIGRFIGGIIGGLAAGATSTLPEIGSNLSGFAENAKPFFETMSKLDDSVTDGVMTLATAVGLLSAEGIFNGIIKFVTGDSPLVMFGKQLAEFAPYMKQYADVIGGVNADVVEKTALAAKALAEFGRTVPNQGGMVAWFAGENSIVTFGEELVPFGEALSKYSKSVENVDADIVQKSANAAKAIAEMAKELPNQGGMVSWFTGDNKLSVLAEEMIPFGKAMSEYSDSVSGVSEANVQKSANAAKMIADFIELIPNQGGMVSWFTGDNTLGKLAKELTKFGPAMADYSNIVADVKIENVERSIKAAKIIIDMFSNLPARSIDLEEFGENFVDIGKALNKYYDKIEKVDLGSVEQSIETLRTICSMISDLSATNVEGIVSFTTALKELGKTSVKEFVSAFENSGGDIRKAVDSMFKETVDALNQKSVSLSQTGLAITTAIANGMRDGMKLIPEAIRTKINEAINVCTVSVSKFKTSGASMINGIKQGIAAGKNALTRAFGDVVDACRSSVSQGREKMANAGKELIDAVGRGIKTNRKSMEGAISDICKDCLAAIERYGSSFLASGKAVANKFAEGIGNHSVVSVQNAARTIVNAANGQLNSGYWSAYNAGTNLVQGFANGIRNSAYLAANAARAVANNANLAFKRALKIQSPSRVMMENGKWFDLGFAKGILKNEDSVTNSVTSLADTAMKSMKNAMALIPRFLDEDFEFKPVVKPVLDMSDLENVQNGIGTMFAPVQTGQISSLFNKPKSTIDVKSVSGGNTDKLLNDVITLLSDIKSKDTNIYMDGRQVSKAITSKIDNELAFNQRKRW